MWMFISYTDYKEAYVTINKDKFTGIMKDLWVSSKLDVLEWYPKRLKTRWESKKKRHLVLK
jgi:hypothetical protein